MPGSGCRLPDPGDLGDVAVDRAIEVVREPAARANVRHAVVHADESTGFLAEPGGAGDRHEHVALRGDERIARHVGCVVQAAVVDRGIGVEVQLERRSGRLEAHADDDRLVRRIGERFTDDPIAARPAGVGLPERQHVSADWFHAMIGIDALALEKARAIGDEELEHPEIRAVDGWIVRLGQNAVAEREPDLRDRRECGADALFVAVRPRRLRAGATGGERWRLAGPPVEP